MWIVVKNRLILMELNFWPIFVILLIILFYVSSIESNLLVLAYNHVTRNWSTQYALSIHHFHQSFKSLYLFIFILLIILIFIVFLLIMFNWLGLLLVLSLWNIEGRRCSKVEVGKPSSGYRYQWERERHRPQP